MMTVNYLQEMETRAAANRLTDKWGEGKCTSGRFEVRVVGVGRPSVGHSSSVSVRRDYYLDGKRVKRAALLEAMTQVVESIT